jgi:hypothetical protein
VGFTALAIVAQCIAWAVFNEADGDWMRFIGGGGRSPAVPMWMIFGIWCLLTLLGIAGVAAYISLVVRFRFSRRTNQSLEKHHESP